MAIVLSLSKASLGHFLWDLDPGTAPWLTLAQCLTNYKASTFRTDLEAKLPLDSPHPQAEDTSHDASYQVLH